MDSEYRLKIKKESEFFVAIAKQGLHSFIMLGVVGLDGANHLLARVGATNDIDPNFDDQVVMLSKVILSETKARLADEGIFRKKGSEAIINYQAYSVNYSQAVDFLYLIRDIEVKQESHIPEHKKVSIQGLIPIADEGGQITLQYRKLADLEERVKKIPQIDNLSQQVSKIHINNTCRTTALNMVEAILGFSTKISIYFFVKPKYKTTLNAGLPNKESFYILPPPPQVHQEVSPKQLKVLIALYKRMENIPIKNPASAETRKKFEALKGLYKSIAGGNRLSSNDLLCKIIEHEAMNKEALYAKRNSGLLSKALNLKSSTELTFSQVKKELSSDHQKSDIEQKKEGISENRNPVKR